MLEFDVYIQEQANYFEKSGYTYPFCIPYPSFNDKTKQCQQMDTLKLLG